MGITTGYFPGHYSRMDIVARDVCYKQLKISDLNLLMKELYPDNKIPGYFELAEVIISRLKVAMREAFTRDENLKNFQLSEKSLIEQSERYSIRLESVRRVEAALEKMTFKPPSTPSAPSNSWCVLS